MSPSVRWKTAARRSTSSFGPRSATNAAAKLSGDEPGGAGMLGRGVEHLLAVLYAPLFRLLPAGDDAAQHRASDRSRGGPMSKTKSPRPEGRCPSL